MSDLKFNAMLNSYSYSCCYFCQHVRSSMSADDLAPLAGMHAHDITLPPPCSTDNVVCIICHELFDSLSMLFLFFKLSILYLSSWSHLSKEFFLDQNRFFFFNVFWQSLTSALLLTVSSLCFHSWGHLLIMDYLPGSGFDLVRFSFSEPWK